MVWSAPSHYLNQCWDIVNWTLRKNFQWNFNRHSCIFIQEIALKNVVCELASILLRPQCVNQPWNRVSDIMERHWIPYVLCNHSRTTYLDLCFIINISWFKTSQVDMKRTFHKNILHPFKIFYIFTWPSDPVTENKTKHTHSNIYNKLDRDTNTLIPQFIQTCDDFSHANNHESLNFIQRIQPLFWGYHLSIHYVLKGIEYS